MKTTIVLFEFVIIGFLSFLIFAFLYLIIFNIKLSDIDIINKDNGTISFFVLTMIFYLLGTIVHRFIQILNFGYFRKVFFKVLNYSKLKSLNFHPYDIKPEDVFEEPFLNALQNASESIIFRITYQQSLLRLYKACAILFPILGVLLFIWFRQNSLSIHGTFSIIILFILSAFSTISYLLLFRNLTILIDKVDKLLNKNKKNNAA